MPLDSAFDIRYLPQSENAGADEQEVEEDDPYADFKIPDDLMW